MLREKAKKPKKKKKTKQPAVTPDNTTTEDVNEVAIPPLDTPAAASSKDQEPTPAPSRGDDSPRNWMMGVTSPRKGQTTGLVHRSCFTGLTSPHSLLPRPQVYYMNEVTHETRYEPPLGWQEPDLVADQGLTLTPRSQARLEEAFSPEVQGPSVEEINKILKATVDFEMTRDEREAEQRQMDAEQRLRDIAAAEKLLAENSHEPAQYCPGEAISPETMDQLNEKLHDLQQDVIDSPRKSPSTRRLKSQAQALDEAIALITKSSPNSQAGSPTHTDQMAARVHEADEAEEAEENSDAGSADYEADSTSPQLTVSRSKVEDVMSELTAAQTENTDLKNELEALRLEMECMKSEAMHTQLPEDEGTMDTVPNTDLGKHDRGRCTGCQIS